MDTSIEGKIRIKLFWRCAYTGGGVYPIQRLFRIGKLLVCKVVYSRLSPFSKEYYKQKVIEELKKAYDVRWEKTPVSEDFWYTVYSNVDGGYIGTPEEAYRQYQRGLRFIQKAHTEDKVCSIGLDSDKQKWFGWSHRAMYGFGVGDIVKDGDCCASSRWTDEYLKDHPQEDRRLPIGFIAKSMEDAKRMAIAFAESVS